MKKLRIVSVFDKRPEKQLLLPLKEFGLKVRLLFNFTIGNSPNFRVSVVNFDNV